jgi:hypothetical protein
MMALPVAVLLLSLTPANAAELPFAGTFGSPAACAIYRLGGVEGVWRDGLDELGVPLLAVNVIEEDDGLLLLQPAGLTTAGLKCSVGKVEGTQATFDCSDGAPLEAVVVVTSSEKIVFNDGEVEYLLQKCPE